MNWARVFLLAIALLCASAGSLEGKRTPRPSHKERESHERPKHGSKQDDYVSHRSFGHFPQAIHTLIGNLFKVLDKAGENIAFSPLSIEAALGTMLLAADAKSKTERELFKVMGINETDKWDLKIFHDTFGYLVKEFAKHSKNTRPEGVDKERGKPKRGHEKADNKTSARGDEELKLDLANMLITKNGGKIKSSFEKRMKKYYGVKGVKNVDDKDPETIDSILEELEALKTRFGFKKPVMEREDLEKKFAAILLSVFHVQSSWFKKFYSEEKDKAFHNLGKSAVAGEVIYTNDQSNSKYLEFTTKDKAKHKSAVFDPEDRSLSKLPNYKGHFPRKTVKELFGGLNDLDMRVTEIRLQGKFTFVIVDPLHPSGKGDDLANLTKKLFTFHKSAYGNMTFTKLNDALIMLDTYRGQRDIDHLRLPKFNFENEIELRAPLQKIGLKRMFDENQAELGGAMAKKIHVSEFKQQAMIDVNEFGVKAAAVTKVQMELKMATISRNKERIIVEVEHPFLFIIRYSGIPVFMGKVVKL